MTTPVSNDVLIELASDRLTERLLAARHPHAHWTGELSSSALSTATASVALHLARPGDPLATAGLTWLERTQNPDGGFGDTILSFSNLSTSALCWAAFTILGTQTPARDRVLEYVRRTAGGVEPETLVRALEARYGTDRTFSVPILTVLASAGLVPWRLVPQLPFELAALPRSWFSRVGLPVVSYALPALIAIGQVRHRRQPSRNPLTRAVRAAASNRTLTVLDRIQPPNGGYLEAAPLTSFVCISLLVAGISDTPVLTRGLDFLRRSARPDGSWPIDTNLSTWVTTLSVNALRDRLPESEREPIARWLVAQQNRDVHPFTGAAPGGWAWTDLPGGVPDADDTSGALVALHELRVRNAEVLEAAALGVRWLLDLQNRDGGMPTFCRGWGKLPFDRSSNDITAHALQAWTSWRPSLTAGVRTSVDQAIASAIAFLGRTQRADGAWTPLWFGNQSAPHEENPVYGTARVLLGLQCLQPASTSAERATAWLLSAENDDGGWGGDKGLASSIEETALAVSALAEGSQEAARAAATRGAAWLAGATRCGEVTSPSPIGFYFAKLWYFESLYPMIFAVDALRRCARRG